MKYTFFFYCYLLTFWCNAQTILAPGDAAFVGIAANIGDDNLALSCETGAGSERDQISFVCFKDITTGTVIDLTDNGWERRTAGKWGNSEGFLRMIRTGGTISAGKTITIELPVSAGPPPLAKLPDNGWQFTQTGILNFNSGTGDQLYMLQGGTWNNGTGCPGGCQQDATYTGGQIICAFTNVGWLATPPGSADIAQGSRLHPDISTCFAPFVPGDFISYRAPQSATTPPVWTARFRNAANWNNFADCNTFVRPPDSIFLVKTVARLDCISNCTGCKPLASSLRLNLLVPVSWGPFTLTYTDGTVNRVINNAFDGLAFSVTSTSNVNYSIVSVTAANGCPVPFTYGGNANITTQERPIIPGIDTLVCTAAKIDLLSLVMPNPNFSYSFHTGPNPNGANLLLNPSVTVNNSVTYYGQALTPIGCRDTFPIHFNVQSAGVAGIPHDTVLCVGDSAPVFSLYEALQGESVGGTWSVRAGDGKDPGTQFNRPEATLNPNNLVAGDYAFTYTAPCNPLSKANVMVYVRKSPKVSIATEVADCAGKVTLTTDRGTAPYRFDWSDLVGANNPSDRAGLIPGNYTIAVADSNHCTDIQNITIPVYPPDTVLLEATTCDSTAASTRIQHFKKVNGCDSVSITRYRLLPTPVTRLSTTTCDPLLAGTFQKRLPAQNGCDSVVITTTALLPKDTVYLRQTSCDRTQTGVVTAHYPNRYGCDSMVVTTTALLPTDTVYIQKASCDRTQTGVVAAHYPNRYGCDSTVVTTTALLPTDTVYVQKTSCDRTQTGVVTAHYANRYGCDSTVVTTTALLPTDTVYVQKASCDRTQTGVVTAHYANRYGCDSTVVTTTMLLPTDTVYVNLADCDPRLTGIVEQHHPNRYGCDSLVVVTTRFLPSDSLIRYETTCDSALTGTTKRRLTNVAGCDSVIVTITTLQPPDSFLVRKYTCDPALAGLVAVPFKSSLGCDSIVVTQTLYVPPVTTFLKETTCRLDSAGQFTRHLKGWAGCDSVVMIERVFLTADSTVLNTVTCDPLQAGVQIKGLISSTGCDSIVITKVTLLPTPSTYIERESCDPQEAGVKVMQIKTPAGCDSLVIITTVYLRPDTTYQTDSTCNKVNTGRFFRRLSNQKGCDSLIVTDVWLLPNPEGTLSPKLCNGEFIVMNGNRYDLKRRNGREVLSGAAFNGCDSVVNIRLLYSFLDLKISWNGPTCYRGLDGRITIDTIRNGKRPYSIQIDDSRPVPLQFPLVWPGLPAGPHRIYIADAEMCIYEDTLMLPSPPEQIFDLGSTPAKIRLGDSLILKSVRNFEPERVVWQDNSVLSCTTCVEPAAYPLSSVHVEVTAFDSLGCAVSDALNIEVEKSDDIYVATAFSPDKDGENDEIWVSCGPSVAKIRHFAIFDRWGNLVFERRDVPPNSDATRWNGQLDGRVLPPAVYIYQVEVDYIDGRRQVLRGDMTLLR